MQHYMGITLLMLLLLCIGVPTVLLTAPKYHAHTQLEPTLCVTTGHEIVAERCGDDGFGHSKPWAGYALFDYNTTHNGVMSGRKQWICANYRERAVDAMNHQWPVQKSNWTCWYWRSNVRDVRVHDYASVEVALILGGIMVAAPVVYLVVYLVIAACFACISNNRQQTYDRL